MSPKLKAFLSLIAYSEGTINEGDNGYNVIVGGKLFENYSDHPRVNVWIKRIKKYSTAAGRYQILARNYDVYKKLLRLPDFGPESQDEIAIQLIRECKAIEDIESGKIKHAITKCRSRWASFPGAGYDQHENKMEDLLKTYNNFLKQGEQKND